MDILEGKRLRDVWKDRPCDHPSWRVETINGNPTGDEVCTRCGHTRWAGSVSHSSSGEQQADDSVA